MEINQQQQQGKSEESNIEDDTPTVFKQTGLENYYKPSPAISAINQFEEENPCRYKQSNIVKPSSGGFTYPQQAKAKQDLERIVSQQYDRKLSPFAEDLTAEEKQAQMETYGRVIFAPCGCISLEEFARDQDRERRILSLQDQLSKAESDTHVYKNHYIKCKEDNIRLCQDIDFLTAKTKHLEEKVKVLEAKIELKELYNEQIDSDVVVNVTDV